MYLYWGAFARNICSTKTLQTTVPRVVPIVKTSNCNISQKRILAQLFWQLLTKINIIFKLVMSDWGVETCWQYTLWCMVVVQYGATWKGAINSSSTLPNGSYHTGHLNRICFQNYTKVIQNVIKRANIDPVI